MKALSLAERLYEAWWPSEPPVAWRDLSADDKHRFYQASQLIGGVLEPIVRSVRPAEAVPTASDSLERDEQAKLRAADSFLGAAFERSQR